MTKIPQPFLERKDESLDTELEKIEKAVVMFRLDSDGGVECVDEGVDYEKMPLIHYLFTPGDINPVGNALKDGSPGKFDLIPARPDDEMKRINSGRYVLGIPSSMIPEKQVKTTNLVRCEDDPAYWGGDTLAIQLHRKRMTQILETASKHMDQKTNTNYSTN